MKSAYSNCGIIGSVEWEFGSQSAEIKAIALKRTAQALIAITILAICWLAGSFQGYQRGFKRGYLTGQASSTTPLVKLQDGEPLGNIIEISVMTLNIHHGEGTDGKIDLNRIADVINKYSPDVVALQEVDRCTQRSSGTDQLATLAQLTNMNGIFGKAKNHSGGEYGNGILSKLPIEFDTSISLPGGFARESRTVVVGRLQLSGANDQKHELLILSTHLDFVPGSQAQIDSVKIIRQFLLQHSGTPLVLAGDMNAEADSETIRLFQRDWAKVTGPTTKPTFPSTSPTREIDHLFCAPRSRWRVLELFTNDEQIASDHLALVAELALVVP